MSGASKIEACKKLDKIEDELGSEGVAQLMKCGGKYPEDFKQVRDFCRSCDLPDSINQGCLASTPHVFEDQHDGDRKMVTLSGNKLSITPIGSAERYFMILLVLK